MSINQWNDLLILLGFKMVKDHPGWVKDISQWIITSLNSKLPNINLMMILIRIKNPWTLWKSRNNSNSINNDLNKHKNKHRNIKKNKDKDKDKNKK